MSLHSYKHWLINLSSSNFLQEETNLVWVVENSGNVEAKNSALAKLKVIQEIKQERNG